jgi:hypothetical protein
VVFAIAGFVPASPSDAMKAVVGSYLQIQRALAADKTAGVPEAAKAIAAQAAKMGTDGQSILAAAKKLETAADIEAARTAFGELSEGVIAAGKAEGWKDLPDVKVAYCPMVKKPWLQTEDTIRNPYYGSTMLTCGEFKTR